ncbi:MAG: hypothetical protein ABI605_12675 [Rhizobacter sp.]
MLGYTDLSLVDFRTMSCCVEDTRPAQLLIVQQLAAIAAISGAVPHMHLQKSFFTLALHMSKLAANAITLDLR